MEQFEIISEDTIYSKKEKSYTIVVNDFEVQVKKWWEDDSDGNFTTYENDYTIINDEDTREELSDSEYDDLISFIMELNVLDIA